MDPDRWNDAGPSTSQPSSQTLQPALGQQYQQQQQQQHGVGSNGNLCWYPKARITYSDRFIPSRAAAARLDFSILDREIVTSEVSKSATEREVRATHAYCMCDVIIFYPNRILD